MGFSYNTWGGSWNQSWSNSWGAGSVTPDPTPTPPPVNLGAGSAFIDAAEKRLRKYKNYGKDYLSEEKLAKAREIIEQARNSELPAGILELFLEQIEAEIAQRIAFIQQERDERDMEAILRLLHEEEIEIIKRVFH